MATTAHPTYPNPTIQETLCEIQFRLQEDVTWNPSWYGDFYRQVENRFPIILPVSTPHFRFDIDQVAMPTLVIPQVMRYQSNAENVLLQLSENRIIVNVLPDYPGWAHVSELIKYSWEQVCKVMDPAVVIRVALRYINRIDRRTVDETLGDWLVANDYIPVSVLTSYPGFISRVTAQLNPEDKINVIVSDREILSSDPGSFLLDIEHSTQHEMTVDTNLLLQEATRLHAKIWEVFRSAKGERLEQLLQGEIL